jgi:hypothetical protein
LIRKPVLKYGNKWAEHFYEALMVIRVCFRTATRLLPFEVIFGQQPVLPAQRRLAAKYQVYEATTPEGETQAEERMDRALAELVEVKRINILLRQAHQANLRATAAANRDIN